ncbi:ATP-binding protein [Gluconobacter oxydans]|uniref:ATP-binding protein n=1 Tax=Gluconobacter oxydans TaxID=442 RepID=UPI0039EB6112
MDATKNPYAPGAGTPPPILAGRDEILERTKVALARVKNGFPERSFIAVGLRGVGKTVIMNQVQQISDEQEYYNCYIEAYDGIDLPKEIVFKLRSILIRLSKKIQSI